jgi:hypothetical protein
MSASATPVPRAADSTKRSFMIPIRAACDVDQDQKIVAKPMALPWASRAMSCSPSRAGSAMRARLIASSASSLGATS